MISGITSGGPGASHSVPPPPGERGHRGNRGLHRHREPAWQRARHAARNLWWVY